MENRTILALLAAVVFVATLWWTSRAPGKLVSEQTQQARVLTVEMRKRGPDKQTRTPVLVTVELGDGGRGKLWMGPPGPAVGAPLEVHVRIYDNGVRRLSTAR